MELQFESSVFQTLQWAAWEPLKQEQTLEVKLTDAMPDIGRVVGAWGQCVLRSKEWRGNGMTITGGVMVWALYAAEEDAKPIKVDGWIPFQMKWDVPPADQECTMRICCQLRSIDARTISARKLMFRVNVAALAEAVEPRECQVYQPGQVDERIQLLRQTYPIMLPKEAGEKAFTVEEEMSVPVGSKEPESICAYNLTPEIQEQKVMGERIVFRGTGNLHLLYQDQDGRLNSCQMAVPFSQFSDLNDAYSQDAEASILPAITSLELELTEDRKIKIKGGIAAQYVISDRVMVETVEDGYCLDQSVEIKTEELKAAGVLDRRRETFQEEMSVPGVSGRIVDVRVLQEYPGFSRTGDLTHLQITGQIQVLYYDDEENLQMSTVHFEDEKEIAVSSDTDMHAYLLKEPTAQGSVFGEEFHLSSEINVEICAMAQKGIPMVTGLELGEMTQPDPDRPSLILRRASGERLWDMAKQCRSTVEAIRQTNGLQNEPAEGQIVIIPLT